MLPIIFQLDKALLCHQCQRFRCICERESVTSSSTTTNSTSTTPIPPASIDQLNCNSIGGVSEDTGDNSNVILRRSSSRSNTSLNFGTNIFKRFAERMSANNNFLSTTLRSSSNHDLLNEPR